VILVRCLRRYCQTGISEIDRRLEVVPINYYDTFRDYWLSLRDDLAKEELETYLFILSEDEVEFYR